MGVREDLFEVDVCIAGTYMTRMVIMDKRSGFKWNLINVYGAAHVRNKEEFLMELVQALGYNKLPCVLGAILT